MKLLLLLLPSMLGMVSVCDAVRRMGVTAVSFERRTGVSDRIKKRRRGRRSQS